MRTATSVDQYIGETPSQFRPILVKLRKAFHKAHPKIEEAIKWGVPAFEYKGRVGGIAAFKEHCRLWLWKGNLLKDPSRGLFKITKLSDLPAEAKLVALIKRAVALNDAGVEEKRPAKAVPGTPPDFTKALGKASAKFKAMTAACKQEYIEWITDAKRPETRQKRIKTAVEWISDGKTMGWKYA